MCARASHRTLPAWLTPIAHMFVKSAQGWVAPADGADATIVPCQSITVSVQNAAPVPITGVTAGTTDTYGGQPISTVQVTPGNPVTIPISCS